MKGEHVVKGITQFIYNNISVVNVLVRVAKSYRKIYQFVTVLEQIKRVAQKGYVKFHAKLMSYKERKFKYPPRDGIDPDTV